MESSISVAPQLAANLDGRGYKTLTPIQKAVLTKDLTGKDALVSAQTGSGKTTLINIILGLLKPTEGEILIDGNNLNLSENKIKKIIG